MVKQLMPAAQLETRVGDIQLSEEQYLKLSLFFQLKRKPSLDKFPGALIVRRFKKGEVFGKEKAGWTAYYILTSEDGLAIRQMQLEVVREQAERQFLHAEVANLQERLVRTQTAVNQEDARRVATVYLAIAQKPRERKDGPSALGKLFDRKGHHAAGPVKNLDEKTFYIPMDGPLTLNYESLRATLKEGELFGEMSCMYRTPRSATVVANRDCFAIEILRNILDTIQKDPVYKARTDEIYKKRVFELQLRKLSIFSSLTDEEFREVQNSVELITIEPGALICDEHDRSDSMFIVRGGMVKVLKNVSALFGMEHVIDWVGLCALLRQGEEKPGEPAGRVWRLLSDRARSLVRTPEPAKLNTPDRIEIVTALNDLIKQPGFFDHTEFTDLSRTLATQTQAGELLEQRAALLKKKKELPDPGLRRLHRFLLDAILGESVRPLARLGGPETVLTYCSRGDFFGEMGLMMNQPRSATCVAFGHPNDFGQVELVMLPGKVFWKLMKSSSALRDHVKSEIALRRRRTIERLVTPVWDDSQQVQFSERFEELGLIQGQKLMLIDLDRCTRCDECVKACVATHDDGRTRLYLDGPRFGKYLVPTACRSCLDPVCMIGCPVGSIHRGDNREIVIEDWCIGCGLCADQCPYGSILMHDLGIIPEKARGWRWLPASEVAGDHWKLLGFRDSGWLIAEAPLRLDREMQGELAAFAGRDFATQPTATDQVCCRLEFALARAQLTPRAEFKLEIVSQATNVTAWLNGVEVKPDDKPKRGRRDYTVAVKPQPGSVATAVPLQVGKNMLAVQVALSTNNIEVLLQARLDEVRRPTLPAAVDDKIAEEITEKLVSQRAVVCDLCSDLPGQSPACVHACPHEAAMRVNARLNFPT